MARVAFALIAVAACLAVAAAQPYPGPTPRPPLPENVMESLLPYEKFWGMGKNIASSQLPTGQIIVAMAVRSRYDPMTGMSEALVVVAEIMADGALRVIQTVKSDAASGPAADSFGTSIALEGSTLIVASPWHTPTEGMVFMYECTLDNCVPAGSLPVTFGSGTIIKASGRSLLITEEAFSPDHQMHMFRKSPTGNYDPVNPIPLSDSTTAAAYPNAIFLDENHIIFTRNGGLEINEFTFDEPTGQWVSTGAFPTPFMMAEYNTRLAFDKVSNCFAMYSEYAGMRPNSLWCRNPDTTMPTSTTPPPPSFVYIKDIHAPKAPGSMDSGMPSSDMSYFAGFVNGHFIFTSMPAYPYSRFMYTYNPSILVSNMDGHLVASHVIPGHLGFEPMGTGGSVMPFSGPGGKIMFAFTSAVYHETMHPDGTWSSVSELGFYTVMDGLMNTLDATCKQPAGEARYYAPLDCIVDPFCKPTLHGDCMMPAFEYDGVRYFCRMDEATHGMQVVFSGCGGPAPLDMPADGSAPYGSMP